ncbi:MAG: hypothetical protein HYX52_00470 [Chloroflexi bacterium]|nr:hypothetical protein [Chloroflexota bacterium]
MGVVITVAYPYAFPLVVSFLILLSAAFPPGKRPGTWKRTVPMVLVVVGVLLAATVLLPPIVRPWFTPFLPSR